MENQQDGIDTEKISKEMSAAHPTPKAEDSSPIAFGGLDEIASADKQRKIVDDLTQMFNDWDTARKPRESVWLEIYRRYLTVADRFKTLTRSNITMPIVFQIVEAAVPKVVNTLFSTGEEFFDVLPIIQESQEMQVKAQNIKRLLMVQLSKANFFVKFVDFVKQLMLYGTSYFEVYWKVKRDWVWERIPTRVDRTILGFKLGSKIIWNETKTYRVVDRRPEVDVLDILDVYPDPMAETVNDGRGLFVRSWIQLDELKEMGQGKYPVYANTESADLQSTENTYSQSRQDRDASKGVNTAKPGNKTQVELVKFYGRYDVDGDGIKEEAVIVLGNRKVVLMAKPNPFHHQKRPVIRGVLFPLVKEWFGIGLIEPVISQVHELDTIHRQRLDNVNQILNCMWQVDTLADVDLDTCISAPNNIVLTDRMDAVKKLDTPNVTESSYTEAQLIQSNIERATIPPSAQGSPQSGQLGRTARGAQLIIGQALEKFGTATKLIEDMGLKQVLYMFHQLNLQFIDDDDVLRDPILYGEIAAAQMTPEDIRTKVDFKMLGISEMVGSEGKINQIVSFMGVFGKVLSPESISSLAKKIWKLMGFSDKDITLAGQQLQPGVENVIDPAVSAAIVGQAGNQGTAANPPTAPGIGAS